MITGFGYFAFLKYIYLVGVHNGGESVSNNNVPKDNRVNERENLIDSSKNNPASLAHNYYSSRASLIC